MTKNEREDFVSMFLEDYSFEELLEHFDLSPTEVFEDLFKSGMIDPELLEELSGR